MEMCAACALELNPAWKFCIRCGTPVPARTERQADVEPSVVDEVAPVIVPVVPPLVAPVVMPVATPVIAPAVLSTETPEPAMPPIPSRYPLPPESLLSPHLEYTDNGAVPTTDGVHVKRTVDVPLMVSIGLSTAGVILIVYLAIVIFGAHG
jgi:hypothetical protein